MSILRRRALIEQGNSIPYWYNIDEDWDYIIDQTGKYENPIIVNEDNLSANKLTSISDIRSMSKLVIGYYDETSAKLIWEPLDNSSKTIVKHATSVRTINMKVSSYIAEHPTADVFMKLPEFWWRCWNIDNDGNIAVFKFVTEEPTDGNTWNHWDGNIFIGAYKSGTNKVNDISVLRSISGITEYLSDSCDNYRTFARNKGAGYSCVTYEAHQIMALLFFGFYGHADDTDIFGAITSSSYLDKMGTTDAIGISKDDNVIVNDNMTTHSYWGLENWCRGNDEHIDNIRTIYYSSSYVKINIYDIYGLSKYFFNAPVFNSYYYYISTLMLPEIIAGETTEPYLFKGLFKTGRNSDLGAIRNLDNGGGLVPLDISHPKNTAVSLSTSRLQYEGNNEQYNGLNPPAITISSYTIDQTGPYTTDPKDMITFNTDNKVIIDIRANSDFYACENKDWGTDTPEFIKMSKNHKLTTAGGVLLDANNYDIFMKLPEFWWKCENVDNNEDKVKFSFTMINPNDNTWHHWEGNTFIGVYKSYYNNNRIYSRSGATLIDPSPNTTIDTLKQSARNRGTGFQLITYEAHQIIALLEFGYLASVSKSGFYDYKGYGQTQTTGILNSSGFSSGYAYSSALNKSWYNFWGLENWLSQSNYDDEVLDNLVTNKRDGKVCADVLDYNGNVVRSVYCDSVLATTSYAVPAVTKLVLGEYGDILPKSGVSGTNDVRCYGVSNYIHSNSTGYIFKKGYYNFVSFNAQKYNTPSSYDNRSRLLYKGNYTVAQES